MKIKPPTGSVITRFNHFWFVLSSTTIAQSVYRLFAVGNHPFQRISDQSVYIKKSKRIGLYARLPVYLSVYLCSRVLTIYFWGGRSGVGHETPKERRNGHNNKFDQLVLQQPWWIYYDKINIPSANGTINDRSSLPSSSRKRLRPSQFSYPTDSSGSICWNQINIAMPKHKPTADLRDQTGRSPQHMRVYRCISVCSRAQLVFRRDEATRAHFSSRSQGYLSTNFDIKTAAEVDSLLSRHSIGL